MEQLSPTRAKSQKKITPNQEPPKTGNLNDKLIAPKVPEGAPRLSESEAP